MSNNVLIHASEYDNKDGWIQVEKELPPVNITVEVVRVKFHDWNLETKEWKSTGRLYMKHT